MDRKQFLFQLFLKTESFVYLVPIPLVLYFGLLCLEFTQEKLLWFGVAALLGGGLGFVVGLVLRRMQLYPLLAELEQESKGREHDLWLKVQLLEYPKKEGWNVVFRWLVGVGVAWIVLRSFTNLTSIELTAIPYVVLIALPISYSSFYYITESCTTELLRASRLGNLMDSSLFKDRISLERKIFFNLISVTILSSGGIGFLFYFVNTGDLKFNYPLLVLFIFFIAFTLFIYIANKNLSNSIKANHEIISSSLSELAKGKISIRIPIVSKDEYGLMAYDLIQVVIALRRTVESLTKIISEITIYSKQMETNSETLLNLTLKQSKTFENFVSKLDEINKATQVSKNNSQRTNHSMQETKKIQEEIDSNVKNLLNYTSQSEKQASISLQFIDSGRRNIQNNIQIMTQVQNTTSEIQNIVSAIGDVADQVNLLSLNASIESARAGEYGRGFAVVATEISKLAERVLQNSEEIKKISKIVNKNVLEGVESIKSTGQLFEEIHENIINMKERIDSINKTVINQTSSNEQFKKIFQNSIEMSSEILNAAFIQVENVQNLLSEIQILNQESLTLKSNIENFRNIAQNLKERIQTIQTQVNFFS